MSKSDDKNARGAAAVGQSGFLLAQLLVRVLISSGVVDQRTMKDAIKVLIKATGEQERQDYLDATETLNAFLTLLEREDFLKPN